jgi:hypothetical protein
MPRFVETASLLLLSLPAAALSFVPACKASRGEGDGGADAASSAQAPPVPSSAPLASASAADAAAEAPTHGVVVRPASPPAAGNACAAKEAVACAPGGFEELACTAGVWRVSETCRGPGGCKADGAGVHCDPGTPRAGDACSASAVPRCSNVHTVFTCKSGVWESSLCVPPSKCAPNAKNGVAGCK